LEKEKRNVHENRGEPWFRVEKEKINVHENRGEPWFKFSETENQGYSEERSTRVQGGSKRRARFMRREEKQCCSG